MTKRSVLYVRRLLLSSILLISMGARGQTGAPAFSGRCAFEKVLSAARIRYEDLREGYGNTRSAAKGAGDAVFSIPVVVHIVYHEPSYNLSSDVIRDQIRLLNDGFRNRYPDTAGIRGVFKPLAADAGIQFHLATTDPAGNPTTGITRTYTGLKYFGVPPGSNLDSIDRIKHGAAGGCDAWPADRYLNIWVGNIAYDDQKPDVLGYATPPMNPLPPNWPPGFPPSYQLADGVVLQMQVVGSNNPYAYQVTGGYTKGRAAVHEVGHYLGLQHTFAGCGQFGDGIDDTPEQSVESSTADGNCAPADKNSCGAGEPDDLPDMWENHMDYGPDACRVLFTHGQVDIMRSVLTSQRSTLPAAMPPQEFDDNTLYLYPNPASGTVIIRAAAGVERITFRNSIGQVVLELPGTSLGSYDVSSLPAGQYLTIAAGKGGCQAGRLIIVR